MQKIQLSIPTPCHESWEEMTPTQQGRFCGSCAKQVIDFSVMSDAQVLNYFNTIKKSDNVCGRALPDQLERAISTPVIPIKRKFWYWNYVAMFLLFFSKSSLLKAQEKPKLEVAPVKPELNNDVRLKGEIIASDKKIITGKVVDKDGSPISFASIMVKGSKNGVAADANGKFSININNEDIVLQVSSVGFQNTDFFIKEAVNNIFVLRKSITTLEGELKIIVVGGMFRSSDEEKPVEIINHVSVLQVKDNATHLPIKASLTITKNDDKKSDVAFTDSKGIYKIKRIKKDDEYTITIKADGYVDKEINIYGDDFENRKEVKEVLLEKIPLIEKNRETVVRLRGGISMINKSNEPLYVLDGTFIPNSKDVNPNEIDNVKVLKASEATALFGPDGANGAIVITTKKQVKSKPVIGDTILPYKILDTVAVRGLYETTRTCRNRTMGAMISGITIKSNPSDTIKLITTKLTGSLKVYPSPIQKGNLFTVEFNKQNTGKFNCVIIDVLGRVVLQKEIYLFTKKQTEQFMADNQWGSGVYYINLYNDKNVLVNKNSFIVQ